VSLLLSVIALKTQSSLILELNKQGKLTSMTLHQECLYWNCGLWLQKGLITYMLLSAIMKILKICGNNVSSSPLYKYPENYGIVVDSQYSVKEIKIVMENCLGQNKILQNVCSFCIVMACSSKSNMPSIL
jgi:hypothetical protein